MSEGSKKRSRLMMAAAAAIGTTVLIAAACGGGTSSADKTATKAAGGATAAVTSAATKAATTPTVAATSAATKAATTPAAATTAAATKAATTPAAGATGGVKIGTTSLGQVLTDDAGMTLYIWDRDTTPNVSTCTGGCATAWPPAMGTTVPTVSGATGTFAVITRDDGSKQFSYKGKPLYHYANDKVPGDTTGDGVGGVWHVAKP
jgi:predicted lipoprotein with Yx(FWY)xxD motif